MAAHRNDKKAQEMFDLYQQGFSLAKVAEAFGITRQSVYKMFKMRGFPLRTNPEPLPFINFQGRKYTRRNNGYYGCTTGKRSLLHRDIWESRNYPIPDGYEIHHIDNDRANNHISNLELIEKEVHASQYPGRKNGNSDIQFCKRGHEFTPENTYQYKGSRICRTCSTERTRNYRHTAPAACE